MIQSYYEMHFAPFISGQQIAARLSYPELNIVHPAGEGMPVEGFAEVRHSREDGSEGLREFYQSVAQLISEFSLTEEFYQYTLDLCRPFIQPDTVVLDIGCGLGRTTAEVARLGADYVIGLDLSPRMVEEAARLIDTEGPLPIKLNLVGGKTVSAEICLGWTLDNCDFIVSDVQRLPLDEEQFDLILCLNLVDRLPVPRNVVGQMARVLKRGGHVLISDPYDWKEGTPRQNWTADMADWFDERNWKRVREIDGVPFVLRSRSSRRITIYMNHCLIYQKMAAETPEQ
jgi:SAM-dependent methyltransferase